MSTQMNDFHIFQKLFPPLFVLLTAFDYGIDKAAKKKKRAEEKQLIKVSLFFHPHHPLDNRVALKFPLCRHHLCFVIRKYDARMTDS
jgi:hypothetical protein